MPKYRFPIQSATGDLVDDTAPVELSNDSAARVYAQTIINELNDDELGQYLGWTMDIKVGDRLGAIIPFSPPN